MTDHTHPTKERKLPHSLTLEEATRFPTTALIASYADGKNYKQLLVRIDLSTQAVSYWVGAKRFEGLIDAIEAYNNV
jgi:hypothetical protein